MGLGEDTVDLFEIHDAGLVAHGFNERPRTKIVGAAQETMGRHCHFLTTHFAAMSAINGKVGRSGIPSPF